MSLSSLTCSVLLWFGLSIVGAVWAGGVFAAIHAVQWRRTWS